MGKIPVSLSVLLVDSNFEFLDASKRFLEERGEMRAEGRSSLNSALEAVKEAGFDVIVVTDDLLDIRGIDLFCRILAERPGTPMIIITSKVNEQRTIAAMNLGAKWCMVSRKESLTGLSDLKVTIREVVKENKEKQDLVEREQRFHESLERFRMPVFQIDLRGKMIYCNKTFLQRTGRNRDEVLGKDWVLLCVQHGDREYIRKAFLEIFESGKDPGPLLCTFVSVAGKEFPLRLSCTLLPAGRDFGPIISVIGEDIVLDQKGGNAEERLRILFEYAPEAYILHDLNGRITDANRAAEVLTGYKKEELIEKNLMEAGLIPKEELHKGIALLARHVSGHPTGPEEILIHRKDGSTVVVEMRHYPVRIDGHPLVLGSAHDITERKHAEDALRRANAKLNLLHNITRHDILNTLTALLLYMELLKEDPKDEGQRDIFNRVELLAQTIKKQVEFTRTYQDIGNQSPQWQNVANLIRSSAVSLDLTGITLEADVDGIEIYADPLLENVFHNLLDNSLRHGGKVTSVWLSSLQDINGLKLIYEDNGQGIPGREKEEIFRRGYGKHTGFGLFLSREILAITNLGIKETGTYGKGARFEIRIPPGSFRIVDVMEKSSHQV